MTKLILLLTSCLLCTASAFGVTPVHQIATRKSADNAIASPLFRDPTLTRGGAVPGWAAYNEALDKKPLVTKAMTSLVGWALGDLLAQVRSVVEYEDSRPHHSHSLTRVRL